MSNLEDILKPIQSSNSFEDLKTKAANTLASMQQAMQSDSKSDSLYDALKKKACTCNCYK